jgi:hypothetical protein
MVFQTRAYDCEKAQRRFLQMPVVSVNVDGKVYLCEKKDNMDFGSLKDEIMRKFICQESQPIMSGEEFHKILYTSENDAERNRLKHTIASAYNLSRRQAASLFKISRMKARATSINEAYKKAKEIYDMHNYLAEVEQRSFLISQGINSDYYLESSGSESEEEETDDEEDCTAFENCVEQGIIQPEQDSNATTQRDALSDHHFDLNVALQVLRDVQFNWFAFVAILKSRFEAQGFGDILDQYITHITSQLPNCGLTKEEVSLTNQSRLVYLDVIQAKQIVSEGITCESSDDDEVDAEVATTQYNYVISEDNIRKKIMRIKDRARKRAKVDIAKECFLRRKTIKSAKSVANLYPDIGEVMETIAESCDVGADKWRRTGVYTFSGDPKKVKRLTFKRLQKKLSDHYGWHFSYGTVVQLCVARNKRRSSSQRYKGLAKIKYQQARKGFSLKFNPDTKWSRSLYKNLV